MRQAFPGTVGGGVASAKRLNRNNKWMNSNSKIYSFERPTQASRGQICWGFLWSLSPFVTAEQFYVYSAQYIYIICVLCII